MDIKMKSLIIFLTFYVCVTSFAQDDRSEWIDLLKSNVQKESKNLIKQNLELTSEQAKVFWPIYDEYDQALAEITNERLQNISEYMVNYNDLDSAKAESLLRKALDLDQKKLDVQNKYYEKFIAVLPPTVVGRFFQLDQYIELLIHLQRSENIPLIQLKSTN
jgi:Spy/CpxP family protein refolding chaperone